MSKRFLTGCFAVALFSGAIQAQQPPIPDRVGAPAPAAPVAPAARGQEDPVSPRLKFSNATLDIVLADYAEKTGRTLLQGPGLPNATITLRSQGVLTMDEYLQAIESVLAMYGIALLRVEDKFLKVVPNTRARQEGMEIIPPGEATEGGETDRLISQLIPLKHIDIAEAQKAIESLKHAYGQVQIFERINSILVTDTQANVNRFLQIIGYIDQPAEAREEPNIVVILHAKASEIKAKLEEIIADQQEEQKTSTVPRSRTAGPPGVVRPNVPGVIRARPAPVDEPEDRIAEIIEMAERGVIRGKVKIVADDRTNILIIITRPENMAFFEKIIAVLDVETDPDVAVKIVRLEYADAETVESTLNSLIGSSKSSSSEREGGGQPARDAEAGRSAALREFVDRSQASGGVSAETKSKVGELSADNIKILADERTNALLIMASRSDLATLEEIVRSMDIMLSQVMIESVIVQVLLDDEVSSGVQWVQRSMIAYENRSDGGRRARTAYAGSFGGGGITRDASAVTSLGGAPGLTAYFTHFGMNMDAIVTMLENDSRTQVMSAPVIVTTDNTEAALKSNQQKYFLKGSTVDQFGNVQPQTELQDIGLELTVTPRINVQGNVMMEIKQEVSDEGASQSVPIGGTGGQTVFGDFPTKVTRSFEASIAVHNGETIVLGGLVRNSATMSRSGVPLLSRIPLLGWLFRSTSDRDERAEVVVFVTPHVLDTPGQIASESRRRKEALNIRGVWTRGWSGSKLADEADARWTSRRGVEGGETPEADPEASENRADEMQEGSELDPALMEFMRLQEDRLQRTSATVEKVD